VAKRDVLRRLAACMAVFAVGPTRAARDAGAAVTADRPLDGQFDAVRLDLPADFVMRPAVVPFVRVTAARDVEPLVRVVRRDGELVVDANRSFQTRDPLRIEIGYRRLRRARIAGSADVVIEGPRDGAFEVIVRGSADVQLERLNLSALRIDIEGSATVTAAGAATEQTVDLKGSAAYEARDLKSRRVIAELHGSSEATVDATEQLSVRVDGSASVRYRGGPRVERQVSGTGSVERI
jgi:hypothetical protein